MSLWGFGKKTERSPSGPQADAPDSAPTGIARLWSGLAKSSAKLADDGYTQD